MDDLHDLLYAGFTLLDDTLRRESEERLVPVLVELWLAVFGTILPCIQAVFLPLDLEFKGVGTIMSPREAQEFWGALPGDSTAATTADTPLGEMLDVRRIVLVTFRDVIILSRYARLQAVFSRLSLESINGSVDVVTTDSPGSNPGLGGGGNTNNNNGGGSGGRPGTAASLDPGFGSYNSQGSTLLDDSGGSMSARSRATSNTSSALGGGGGSGVPSPGPPPQQQQQQQPLPSPPLQFPRINTPQPPPQPPQQPPPPPPTPAAAGAGAGSGSGSGSRSASGSGSGSTAAFSSRTITADGARVTETVGRMLQCVSVLASLRSADEAQHKMEELAKALKHNWLGRGRTGRNRRGFVGTKLVDTRERL